MRDLSLTGYFIPHLTARKERRTPLDFFYKNTDFIHNLFISEMLSLIILSTEIQIYELEKGTHMFRTKQGMFFAFVLFYSFF